MRFEWKPEKCLVSNREEIRELFSSSWKVISVFNWHMHWNRKDVHDKIPYFSINSLSDDENNTKKLSESYAFVDINREEIIVDIKWNYPKNYDYKLFWV